jgi:hypothetical protein
VASPICKINGSFPPVSVTAGSTVSIVLNDSAGVHNWSISVSSTDDLSSVPTLTIINGVASFTAGSAGASYIFESKVNNGLDQNQDQDASLTTTFKAYVPIGGLQTIALNETTEGNIAHGWIAHANAAIRAASAISSGIGSTTTTTSYVGGVAYTTITVSNTNRTLDTTTADNIVFVKTSSAPVSLTLPAPTNGRHFRIVDINGTLSTNNLTLVRNGSEKINGVASSKVFTTNWGQWEIFSDGTDWFVG